MQYSFACHVSAAVCLPKTVHVHLGLVFAPLCLTCQSTVTAAGVGSTVAGVGSSAAGSGRPAAGGGRSAALVAMSTANGSI